MAPNDPRQQNVFFGGNSQDESSYPEIPDSSSTLTGIVADGTKPTE